MSQWREFRLKHLSKTQVANGLGEKGEFDDPTWPRYIRTTDIAGPRSLRPESFKSLPPDVATKAMLEVGDILMTAAGATIGKSFTYSETSPACFAGYLVRFRPNSALADGRFVGYWMQSAPYWAQVDSQRVKSTIENFSASRYQNLKLAVPPVSKQRAIADYLDAETARIDALIEKKERMVGLLLGRLWAGIANILSNSDAPWIPMRRCLTDICDGPFGSSLTSSHYVDVGARVIRLGNIGLAEFKDQDQAYISMDHHSSLRRHDVRQGDLLIAGLGDSRNHVGRACVSPDLGQAIVKADCYRARVDPSRMRAEFLAILLSSSLGADEVGLASRGTTRSRINLDIAREVRVPLLPLHVQDQLVADFTRERTRVGRAVDALVDQVELFRELRQAMISAAVTGDLDIEGAAA